MDRLLLSALMAEADEPTQFIGVLDVQVHEARDIQNICIYHKQDVYATLWLTTDGPDSAVSTRTINGGGRNPVFDQRLRLGVRAVEPSSSVRCEVWMLSRIRNYLEDQLLGFALIPLSDVFMASGRKLVDEFSLSSTDLFHSPSGFVKLSVEYTGSLPEVTAVAPPPPPPPVTVLGEDDHVPCELNRIEFPDLNMVSENKRMVSEYFGIPCSNMDTQNSESSTCPGDDDDGCPNHQAGVRVVQSFAAATCPDPVEVPKDDTPASSPSATADSSSLGTTEIAFPPPVIDTDVEPQHAVVQQDIVDMYMKSMQQFTESLANMKLPMDIEDNNCNRNGNRNSNGNGNNNGNSNGSGGNVDGDSGADQKLLAAKKTNSRVFYGSRAFF